MVVAHKYACVDTCACFFYTLMLGTKATRAGTRRSGRVKHSRVYGLVGVCLLRMVVLGTRAHLCEVKDEILGGIIVFRRPMECCHILWVQPANC